MLEIAVVDGIFSRTVKPILHSCITKDTYTSLYILQTHPCIS